MSDRQESRHVVIIGAGIAGLSAASYLLRNGYRVTIAEQHTQCGGLCTSWKRKGYTIDYCVHWLMGTRDNSEFHTIWQELGALTNDDGSAVPIVDFSDFTTIGLSSGETVCLYSDLSLLKAELLRIAPEDELMIDRFCRSLDRLSKLSMPALTERQSIGRGIRRFMGSAGSYLTILQHLEPMQSYAKRFKNPNLREMFLTEIPGAWSLIALSMGLSQQPLKGAGYTVGGSLNLAGNIERGIREMGGTLRYGTPVTGIMVSRDTATGVRLSDGSVIEADYVISAADGHQTVFSMLGGKYLSTSVREAYETYPLFPSTVFVALGVDRDCKDLPHGFSPYFEEPITLPDGTIHHRFGVNVYHYDPTLAPPGKTLVTVLMNTWSGQRWETLFKDDEEAYAAEKSRIAQQVIDRLEQVVPHISEQIEMVDVSTPRSVIRYTGNWQGSFEGFAPTKKTLGKQLPKHLPGLSHFAMIGQWTTPGGGLPTAAKDGRDIALKLCAEDGLGFKAKRE